MKIILSIFLFFLAVDTSAQLSHYNSIKKSTDSLGCLKYFKNLDKVVKEKLDSFYAFMNAKKKIPKEDKGFIVFSWHTNATGRVMADLSLNNQYSEYRIYALQKNNFGRIFAFTFYKSKLVLFRAPYSKYEVKEEFAELIHDLMYAELSKKVQREIDITTNEFDVVAPGIVKRYYFD